MSSSYSRVLPKKLHEVGKALLNHRDVVSAVLNSKDLYTDTVNRIMADMIKECVHREKKRFSSILRQTSPTNLQDFQWSNVLDEWKKEAPLLHRFLTAVAAPSSCGSLPIHVVPAVCVSGAILLRSRNIHMSAVHYLIGLILFHGNLSKTVSCHAD